MNKILVTGGTGYIGSHTVVDLIEAGFEVISVDNYINSDATPLASIKEITGKAIKNYEVDLCDENALLQVFEENPDIKGIIHFAALKSVGDSVADPVLYFRNNLVGLINLVECTLKYNVDNFIFSSSCTVYGNTDELPVTESTPEQAAESPYGRTKQIGEKILMDAFKNTNTKCIALRYFNPAGAHSSIKLGESPVNKALNLVPVVTETAIGKRDKMTVFGKDYDTRDGSCIRDYIHIMDLADAHTKALKFLLANKQDSNFDTYNLGIGNGVSVLEAINAFEKVSGQKLNYSLGDRREGDVIAIYADYSKAKENFGWTPKYGIEDIMDTAWKWEQARSS